MQMSSKEIHDVNGIPFTKSTHNISLNFFLFFFKEMNTMTMLLCTYNRAGQKKSSEFMKAMCLNHPSVVKETQYYCVIECNVFRLKSVFIGWDGF